MKIFTITTLCHVAVAIALAISLIGSIAAEETVGTDFRVDNGIFEMGQTEPASRIVTIFSGGKVYDFMIDSKRITIFDEKEGSFVLIDIPKGIQTVATKRFVDQALERLTQRAAGKNDPRTRFFYNPQFASVQKDTVTGELIFKSPWLTYRVIAKPGDFKAARQYHRFANAYAKLNTVVNPGSKPPFARMLINQTLAEGTLLPKTILITFGEETDPDAARFRSEHRYEMELGGKDQKQIEDIQKTLEKLKTIPIEAYLKRL